MSISSNALAGIVGSCTAVLIAITIIITYFVAKKVGPQHKKLLHVLYAIGILVLILILIIIPFSIQIHRDNKRYKKLKDRRRG